MNRLIKFTFAAAAASLICSLPAFANDQVYGSGIILNLQSGNGGDGDTSFFSNGKSLFEFTLQGDSRFVPSTFTAPDHYVTNSNWTGSASSPDFSLGTFDSLYDTLSIAGGEVLSAENFGNQTQGAQLWYQVSQGGTALFSFTAAPGGGTTFTANSDSASYVGGQPSLGEDSLNPSGNGNGDSRFYSSNLNVNLLVNPSTGLPLTNGTYSLDVYAEEYETYSNGGGSGQFSEYQTNGGPNYNATFSVIPEPSSLMMVLGSGLFGSFYLIKRRRK